MTVLGVVRAVYHSSVCTDTRSSDVTGGIGVPCDGVLGRIVGDLWALPNDTVTVHKSDSY